MRAILERAEGPRRTARTTQHRRASGLKPPAGASEKSVEYAPGLLASLEEKVGGLEAANRIRQILLGHYAGNGHPAVGSGHRFSPARRAHFLLRNCPQVQPRTKTGKVDHLAWLLYLTIADRTSTEKVGRWVTLSHQRLAKELGCSTRSIARAARLLEFEHVLPLIAYRCGRQGRVSQFMFVVDPFVWASQQRQQAAQTRAHRQEAKVRGQSAVMQDQSQGRLTDDEAREKLRRIDRRASWRLPPNK